MDKDKITIFNLPVSGGAFPCQLGLLCEFFDSITPIKEFKRKPDITFAASGGNVSTYLSMAGDWTSYGIYRVCKYVKPELFVNSWFPSGMGFLPTALIGIFKGSLYKDGYGADMLFNKFLTPKSIKETEIWTMTFNVDLFKTEIFCNLHQSECLVQPFDFNKDSYTYDCLDLHYIKTDDIIKKMAKVSHASASIPLLVQSQRINSKPQSEGGLHADGGVMYPSPSTVLKESIINIINGVDSDLKENEFIITPTGEQKTDVYKKPKRMRYFYFEPYDLDSSYPLIERFSTTSALFEQIFHSKMLLDRRVGIDVLMSLRSADSETIESEVHLNMTTKKLNSIISRLEDVAEHYFITLCPAFNGKIAMTVFTTEDLMNLIKKTRESYTAKVWYIPKSF